MVDRAIARLDITRQGVLDAVPEVRKINLRLGMPLAGYGPTPRTRIPTRADAVAIVVAQGDAQFGLARLGGYFQAPWLKQWVPS